MYLAIFKTNFRILWKSIIMFHFIMDMHLRQRGNQCTLSLVNRMSFLLIQGDAAILLNETITFLWKHAKDHRETVEDQIGGNALRGLSNTLHASTDIDHSQVMHSSILAVTFPPGKPSRQSWPFSSRGGEFLKRSCPWG